MPFKRRNPIKILARVEHPFSVPQNASYTPSQMLAMSEKGIPINAQMDESVFDPGSTNCSGVPFESLRGIDIVDCWNASQDAKRNIFNSNQRDITVYG